MTESRSRTEQLRAIAAMLAGRGVHLGALAPLLGRFYGERPALRTPLGAQGVLARDRWTFTELANDVQRLAAAHRAFGHTEGTRVALAVENRVELILHVLALAANGAIAAPVNARLKAAEFDEVIRATRATVIVADGHLVANLASKGNAPHGARWCGSGVGGAIAGAEGDLGEWLSSHPTVANPATIDLSPDAPALLLCTSGTTGHPKAVPLTSEGLLGEIGRLLALPVGHTQWIRAERDRLLCALPLTHVMGLSTLFAALCSGIETLHFERFDANTVLDHIERDRPNVFVGVPTMYADLEANGAERRDLRSIQLWVSAADAMPPDRARRFQKFGAAGTFAGRRVGTALFVDIYGMVELSGPMAARVYAPSPARSIEVPPVSFVLPGFEVRVIDDSGKPLPYGTPGHLQVRGRAVLRAYEGRSGTLDADGWFTTGDLARVWPGGLFTFTGRSRDRLKVGGFSVFPAEVEEALRLHPDVAEVTVVGVPDARLGERPVAIVIPRRTPFDSEAFLAWAVNHVAGYRRPTEVHVVDSLPRGPHGKVDRSAATRLIVKP